MHWLRTLAGCGFLCGWIVSGSLCSRPVLAAEVPDLILHHGKVLTVNADFAIAEALAVKGDRILAVGTNADILKLAGPGTKQVDAGGRTVIPGLIDSHVHPTGAAMYEFDHPIPDLDTVGDVLQYISARAAELEDGDWINLSQVFITRLRDQRYPTRAEMDAAAPKNPVAFRTGPDVALNSLALELSGIDRNSKIPEGKGGKIEFDPVTGEPTGILRNAGYLVKSQSKSRASTEDDRRERLRLLFADYNSVGITSIADRNSGESAIKLYQALKERDELTCRIFVSHGVSGAAPLEQVRENVLKIAAHPLHEYNPWIWVRGVKVFLDGGMLTGSAFMRQPWGVSEIYSITEPDYRGLQFIEDDHLENIARVTLENNLQFTAHSVGDGAVHALVAAYEKINRTLPLRDKRPCITHCNFMSAESIAKMAEIGIVADLQPAWLWLDGATLTKQFGTERLAYFQPYRSIFDSGVVVGGGSDHMQRIGSLRSVNPYNPFLGMWIAVTRQPRRMDGPLRPEQRLTRAEALRLYTINNAFLTFEEAQKGSLEPGKLADFVILNQDLLECPEDAMKDITVAATYVGGKRVFEGQ